MNNDDSHYPRPEAGLFVGSSQDRPCDLPDLFCDVVLGLHDHERPNEALSLLLVTTSSWAERVARTHERNAAVGPVSRYKDHVLNDFISWSVERLRHLAALVEDLGDACRAKCMIEAGRIVEVIRADAMNAVDVYARFDRLQCQQPSGRLKERCVMEIYNGVINLLQEFRDLHDIGYLVDWVCKGAKPGPRPTYSRGAYGIWGVIDVQ